MRPVRKIANSLVTASGAAVLAVYTAGYVRTELASKEFVLRVAERRVASVSARVASVQGWAGREGDGDPTGRLATAEASRWRSSSGSEGVERREVHGMGLFTARQY